MTDPSRLRLHAFIVMLPLLAGCVAPLHQRVTYEERGIQIGLEHDQTIDRASKPVRNDHPAILSPNKMESLLGSVRVTGSVGVLAALFSDVHAIPLFNEVELKLVSRPIADALQQAKPDERVFFSVPDPAKPYQKDRTAGSLFVRGPYLHVMIQDHYVFLKADTSGAEVDRDPRDVKGMRLTATRGGVDELPADAEPAWSGLEKVHLALLLRQPPDAPPVPTSTAAAPSQPSGQTPPIPAAPESGAPQLKRQVEELTDSNLELRARLKEQTVQMEQLKEELNRLKRQIEKASPSGPARRKPSPSPQN
jgi:hypothetical protein